MSYGSRAKFFRRTDVKLTLWYVLTFWVATLLICSFLYFSLRHQLLKEVDLFLLDETAEVERVLSRESKEIGFLMNFEEDVMTRKFYPFFFRVLGETGEPLYVSRGFQELGYSPNPQTLAEIREGREVRQEIHASGRKSTFRVISSPVRVDGKLKFTIQLATHLRFVRKNLSNFKNKILSILPGLFSLGTFGGWLLARRSLSPIAYIVSKTQSITANRLDERLVERGTGDEMDGLIRTINEMIARIEGSFKRLAEFTADVSHELKTPICAMRGEAEVLLSKKRTGEEYEEGLARFIEQFDRLNQLLSDLILLSKTDSTEAGLRKVPVRLDLLVQEMVHLFRVLAEQKKIELSVAGIEEATVLGDKARLQQLFANLIDNAIKYTPRGSVQVYVEKNLSFVQAKIVDTGIGIREQEQQAIFKRFYRVEKSRSRETGGLGLGLSIAHWIAEVHQGKLEVQSSPGKGSTFIVTLPVFTPGNRNDKG